MNLQWNQAEQWQKRDPLLIAIILHPCLSFPFLVWIAAECLAGLFPLAFRWCRRVIGRPKVNRTTKTTTTNSSFQQSTDSCIRWSPVQILLLLIHWIKWGDSLSLHLRLVGFISMNFIGYPLRLWQPPLAAPSTPTSSSTVYLRPGRYSWWRQKETPRDARGSPQPP